MFNISFESEDIGIKNDDINSFSFNDKEIFFDAVSVGNPHAVIFNYDKELNVPEVGAALQKSGIFKDGINVGFANSVNDSEINLRVVERGVGETQACGSGACAAAIIGRKTRNLNQKKFLDCVVSFDVLEHVFISDVPWVIFDIFSHAKKAVFINVASFKASKKITKFYNILYNNL